MNKLIFLAASVYLASGFSCLAQIDKPQVGKTTARPANRLQVMVSVHGSATTIPSAQGELARLLIGGERFTPGGRVSILIERFPGVSDPIHRWQRAEQSGRIGLMHNGHCVGRRNFPDVVVTATDDATGRKASTRISAEGFKCKDDGRGEG